MNNRIVTVNSGLNVGQRWYRNGNVCESIADGDFYRQQLRKIGGKLEVRSFDPDIEEREINGWDDWGCPDPKCLDGLQRIWDLLMEPEPDSNECRKDDQQKIRLDLLPFDAITAAAEVMTWRCTKSESVPTPYPARNWEKGMEWHRLFRAALGHLWDWWMRVDNGKGPGIDKESGRSHLSHALCCVLFLMAYELRKVGTDDRPQ